MKYVKFLMRNRELNITLPMEKAEKVLTSSQQLVMITDKDGKWDGETLNKAEIVGTVRDWDKERREMNSENQIEEPKLERLSFEEIQKFKPEFLKRDVGKTNGAKSIGELL